jgi:streptogramin lyase
LPAALAPVSGETVSPSPATGAPGVVLEEVVPGSPMHGIEGITVGPDGALYVASITARALYRVDPRTGVVRTFVGSPQGGADDLTFGPDGTAVWTGGPSMNALMRRSRSGVVRALVSDTPGLNAVRFAPDGRLFFTRIFGGDGLYEADPSGVKPVRAIAEKIGGLNAFDFAADGSIVGPLFFRGTVNRFDPDTGASAVIAEGFSFPSAVRVLPDGYLVLNYRLGEIWRLDATASSRTLFGKVEAPADNFIVKDGRWLYVTSTAWDGITEFDLATGTSRRVTWGALTAPGMLSNASLDGREVLLVSDDSALKVFDPRTREVRILTLGPTGMGTRGVVPFGDRYAVISAYQPGTVSVVDANTGLPTQVVKGFGRALGLLAIPGALLVTDYGKGEIVEVRVGESVTRRTLASGLAGPVALAASATGELYVSEYRAGRITVLAPVSQPMALATYAVTHVFEGFRHPEGIALAHDGRLLVLDTGRRELLGLDPASGRRRVLARHLAVGLTDGNAPDDPFLMAGVAVMADGSAYVSGDVDNALYRISFSGAK